METREQTIVRVKNHVAVDNGYADWDMYFKCELTDDSMFDDIALMLHEERTRIESGWILVSERLPEPDIMHRAIVCLKNRSVMECHYSNLNGRKRWYTLIAGDIPYYNPVTHWRELPCAPKQ